MIFEKQIVNIFRKQFLTRCDDTGVAHYFSAGDFPGLRQESFPFTASAGHTLQGYFYCYDKVIPGRLIVFDHGFGGGHRSYMKEIEMLCRHGYLVFSYDHTGCMESGGESPNGLSQSLRNLNDCLNALKADSRFDGFDFSVMGHSWGGYSALNIAALHPDISHIVVLSGFVSVKELVGQFFGGILRGYQKPILRMEQENNTNFADYNAVETLSGTKASVLLVYSSNDKMVVREVHYDALKKGLADKENIRFLLLENKGHNPNYTEDAVAYLGEYTKAVGINTKKNQLVTEEQKKAFRNRWDWHRMTKQDEAVWAEIFRTLDAE